MYFTNWAIQPGWVSNQVWNDHWNVWLGQIMSSSFLWRWNSFHRWNPEDRKSSAALVNMRVREYWMLIFGAIPCGQSCNPFIPSWICAAAPHRISSQQTNKLLCLDTHSKSKHDALLSYCSRPAIVKTSVCHTLIFGICRKLAQHII